IKALFPNHGQHIMLGNQLVNMLTYLIVGVLDLRFMNVLGVIALCMAAFLFLSQSGSNVWQKILIFATIFPLVLSPVHNVCIVNVACSANHYLGISFSIMAIYFFNRIAEGWRFFIAAEILLLLANFSLAAALALIPVSFLMLCYATKNRVRYLIIHTMLVTILFAFHSYLTYPDTF